MNRFFGILFGKENDGNVILFRHEIPKKNFSSYNVSQGLDFGPLLTT